MSEPGNLGIRDILRISEIRAALIGTFVIMLGFGILFPILPLYARSFGVGYDAVGLLAASFAFTRLVFDLVAGRMVDRFGERVVATTGAFVVGVSSVLAAMAPTFPLLVVFRGAGGAGSSLFFAALLSYMLRSVPSEVIGRVMGVYYGVFNLGFIVGPPLGGFLAAQFGLRSPLWIYAGSCFVAAALYFRYLTELERPQDPAHRRGALRRMRWDRPFLTVLVANLAQAWVIAAVYSTLVPLFGKDIVKLTAVGISVGIAIASVTEFAALYPAGAAADRVGRKRVLVPSFAVLIVSLATFGLASSEWAFMAALAVLGVISGVGGVAPAAMLSDLTPPESPGTSVGVFRFVGDLGFVVGPLSAGASADAFGLGPAFALSAVPVVVALAMLVSIRETLPRVPRTGQAPGL
ncbi:MAG: MFS transporter [Actinobacteria bacterium]|nr:MFS transporter [Actinomycetota bacterium]